VDDMPFESVKSTTQMPDEVPVRRQDPRITSLFLTIADVRPAHGLRSSEAVEAPSVLELIAHNRYRSVSFPDTY